MSGETQRNESGWSVDTLKEYIELRFTDQDKAVQAALLAAKEAVLKAEVASEKRFESVNEFRAQLSDQTNTFMPRIEAEQRTNTLAEKISELTDRVNRTDGQSQGAQITKTTLYATAGVVVGVLGLIVAIANGVFK